MVFSGLPQFHKDMKDAQELLRKVDSDLNQKYSPDFKDRYQIELLLRELDVSGGVRGPLPGCPGPEQTTARARLVLPWAVEHGLIWCCAAALTGPGEGSGQV